MTPEDFRSPEWRRFTKTLQDRLQGLREFNDSFANSPEKTALIRGQISEVKRLLSLAPVVSERATNLPLIGEIEPSGD
jgi:hypothetical protein